MHDPYKPPAARTAQVTIPTDYGAQAHYEIGQYPGGAGVRLLIKLTMVGTPMAKVFELAIKAFGKSSGLPGLNPDAAQDQMKATAELLKHIDAEGLEETLRAFIMGIVQQGNDTLLREILSCVVKRNVANGPNGAPDSGHPFHQFDRVYQGNYGEMLRACYQCVVHNYGPALRTFLEGNGLSELATGVFVQMAAHQQSSGSQGA